MKMITTPLAAQGMRAMPHRGVFPNRVPPGNVERSPPQRALKKYVPAGQCAAEPRGPHATVPLLSHSVGTDTLSDLKFPKSDIFKLKNGGGLVL